MAKSTEGLNEVYIVSGVKPPVLSGEEGSRDEDLRPDIVVRVEDLPENPVIINNPDEVIIHIR